MNENQEFDWKRTRQIIKMVRKSFFATKYFGVVVIVDKNLINIATARLYQAAGIPTLLIFTSLKRAKNRDAWVSRVEKFAKKFEYEYYIDNRFFDVTGEINNEYALDVAIELEAKGYLLFQQDQLDSKTLFSLEDFSKAELECLANFLMVPKYFIKKNKG